MYDCACDKKIEFKYESIQTHAAYNETNVVYQIVR